MATSIVLHAALGWAVLNLLTVRVLPDPDPPMTIEMAPPMAMPAPAAPAVTPDTPPALPERPRSELAPPKPETPDTPPAPPSPPSQPATIGVTGGTGPVAGPVGPAAAAPRPTYRAPAVYPGRARLAERNGVAVVEILVAAGGAVTDIRLIDETPGGYGFGDAAVKSVRQWRFETAAPGVYRVTVRFEME
ncbi:MAG: TonB family protein [Micropepsaceae bacterium]